LIRQTTREDKNLLNMQIFAKMLVVAIELQTTETKYTQQKYTNHQQQIKVKL
jgi:hypothetical protein